MSIRRKRRQRGKRKVLRREALKTWERLSRSPASKEKEDFWQHYKSVLLPMIRRTMPAMIAHSLVGVQPMTIPAGTVHNMSGGVSPATFKFEYRYDITKKEISEQRKAKRKAKKRERADVAKTLRAKRKPSKGD